MGSKEELLKKLRSEDKEEVREAIESLVDFPEEDVVRSIVDAVVEKRSKAVLEAARATLMAMRGCEEAICREVIRFFDYPEPKLRQAAIDILSHHGNACLKIVEEKLLRNQDYNMRKFALDILANIGSEEALDLILTAVSDENPNVSLTALEYLRGFSRHREKVVKAIKDVIPSIKDMYGLTTLASTVIYGNIKDERLIDPLRQKLRDLKDPLEKHWVYKMLLFLGDRSAVGDALENAKVVGLEEDIRKDMEIFGIEE